MRLTYSIVYLATLTLTLSACGGGGGGGDNDGGGGPPDGQTRSFSVSLEGVDVRRSSGEEEVTVDTSAATTGDLTYQ
jgi:hypothetical protein